MKDISFQARALLVAREKRFHLKQSVMNKNPSATCVEISMNIPGLPKVGRDWRAVFKKGLAELESKVMLLELITAVDKAGYYGVALTNAEPCSVKMLACDVEEGYSWGRLLDIDCFKAGIKISRSNSGLADRRCMVCGEDQDHCISKKLHTVEESRAAALNLISAIE